MKMLLVENDPGSVLNFVMAAKENKWDYLDYALQLPADEGELKRFLGVISHFRPEVVVIDIALDSDEEGLIDDVSLVDENVPENLFSGFRYCQAIVRERWNVPIAFLTKIKHWNVIIAAIKAGADLVLIKRDSSRELLDEIDKLVRSKTPHDPIFFSQLNDKMQNRPDTWQRDALTQALSRFFLNNTTVRRFGQFTASLKGILSAFFPRNDDAEKELMLSLVKSQVLLSLVDSKLRDHVKHTGNVFWIGYQLLHDILEFRQPQVLSGCPGELYDSAGPLTPREQLLHAWMLAALFHDYGYVDERQDQIIALVRDLVPGLDVKPIDLRGGGKWSKNMKRLTDFVHGLSGQSHFLNRFINTVAASFGDEIELRGPKGGKAKLIDHGFLGAHRLLTMIPAEDLDLQKKNIVLHAALAIACHNWPEMVRKWKFEDDCRGNLLLGEFPICSLLAFCDAVQTWDREPDVDPEIARTETYNGFLERLVLSDTAYISGSEICGFSVNRNEEDSGYEIKLNLRYFVENGGNVENVCESLGVDIQKWIQSGRLDDVCRKTGISSILHGEIVYELPMLFKPRLASF